MKNQYKNNCTCNSKYCKCNTSLGASWIDDILKPITTALNATTIKTSVSIDDRTEKVLKTITITLAAAIVAAAYLKARK